MELEERLDQLVASSQILSWKIEDFDENGNLGEGEFRNTQTLEIVFPNHTSIRIGTFCSGCAEDTCLVMG